MRSSRLRKLIKEQFEQKRSFGGGNGVEGPAPDIMNTGPCQQKRGGRGSSCQPPDAAPNMDVEVEEDWDVDAGTRSF